MTQEEHKIYHQSVEDAKISYRDKYVQYYTVILNRGSSEALKFAFEQYEDANRKLDAILYADVQGCYCNCEGCLMCSGYEN